jgi:hypothetical protein
MERPPHLNNAKPAATPKVVLKAAAKPAPAVANTKSTCAVCFDDKTALDTRTLACGHKFCLDCLRGNIQTAVKDKQTQALKCFDPSCKRPIDIADLRKIVYDKNTQNQINDIQLQEWLTQQANIKHCPTTNCHFSFVNERADQFTHKCPDCKAEYCGKCLHTHNPRTTCAQAEQERNLANDKNAQEQATRAWQEANTKPCPQCNARIEKNAGCMHMNCRQCKYHYCWNCLGPWAGHNDYYNCPNRATNPLQPHAQARQQEEEITWQNMHLIFAQDPRGFVNIVRNRRDLQIGITMEFAERFMRLSCEQQGQWTARVTQLLEEDAWNYSRQIYTSWISELERLEPFTLRATDYYATQEGTFVATVGMNRELNHQLVSQIQEWIINNNLQDMITFNGWNCETSLSRERFQQILDQASRHFRDQIPNQPAQPEAPRRVLEVRNNMIYSLPNIPAYVFQQYATYIARFINDIYGARFQVDIELSEPGIHPGMILIREQETLNLIPNLNLRRLVDEAHNHFANLNQ